MFEVQKSYLKFSVTNIRVKWERKLAEIRIQQEVSTHSALKMMVQSAPLSTFLICAESVPMSIHVNVLS